MRNKLAEEQASLLFDFLQIAKFLWLLYKVSKNKLTVGISHSGGSKQSKWYTKGQKSQATVGTPRLVFPQIAQFLGKVSLSSCLSSFHFQL